MNLAQRTLQAIEWPQFLEQYSLCCHSAPAKAIARSITPAEKRKVAETKILQTREALKLLKEQTFDFLGGLVDVTDILQRLRKASVLSGEDFCRILELLHISEEINDRLNKGAGRKFTEIERHSRNIKPLDSIKTAIMKAIADDGSVKSSASSNLKQLINRQKKLHAQIQEKLQGILNSAARDGAVQDTYFDLRDGRYVIPVIRDQKQKVPGLVYESSASEATLFVEPRAVRELNDDIKQVSIEIEEEIFRILRALTDRIRPQVSELETNFHELVAIDLILGRAIMARKYEAIGQISEPIFANYFSLSRFYHPLLAFILKKDDIVTTDIRLSKEQKTLVISGPNTGGKTVILKAMGLTSALSKSGFYIPAASGSTLPWFDKLLVYIDDEQSIEKSLSSFSSSIVATREILAEADRNTLVLIDEIFSSTDPEEAVALAVAVLRELETIGATSVVTTHLSGLKAAPAENLQFTNGCMEFNNETLLPTYKLRLGIPGRSRAIETAQRYGMPRHVLDYARELIDPEVLKIEALLTRIEEKERLLDEERQQFERKQEEFGTEYSAFRMQKEKFERERSGYREKLHEEMKTVERKAMQELEETIAEYREKLKKAQFQPEEFARTKKVIQQTKKSFKAAAPAPEIKKLSEEQVASNRLLLKKSSTVFLHNLQKEGVLLSEPSSSAKEADVQIGIMKIKVPWHYIEPAKKLSQPVSKTVQPVVSSGRQVSVQDEFCEPELVLLGLHKDEVYEKVTNYLDRALRSGRPSVRIVHGVGSGVLKKAVLEILKKGPYNLSYRPAEKGEGGDGCTVVLLDEV